MIHLELQPEIEAQLTAEAKARGLALDRYIETIVAARANVCEPELDEAQLSRDLQQGLREIAEGNTLPARQVFAQIREEYDIRG